MAGPPPRRPHTEIGTVSCDGHVTLQRFAPVSPGYDISPGCSNELSYGEWTGISVHWLTDMNPAPDT